MDQSEPEPFYLIVTDLDRSTHKLAGVPPEVDGSPI